MNDEVFTENELQFWTASERNVLFVSMTYKKLRLLKHVLNSMKIAVVPQRIPHQRNCQSTPD